MDNFKNPSFTDEGIKILDTLNTNIVDLFQAVMHNKKALNEHDFDAIEGELKNAAEIVKSHRPKVNQDIVDGYQQTKIDFEREL